MPSPNLRFKTLQESMEAHFRSDFPVLAFVSGNDEQLSETLPLPAFVFDTPRFELAPNRGIDTLCLRGFFEGRLLLDSKDPEVSHKAKGLAARIALSIHAQTFGQALTPCRITGISNEAFPPEGNQCWLIEWESDLQIGDNTFAEWDAPFA